MKVILVGVGEFGAGWYKQLKSRGDSLQVVVVDPDRERLARVMAPGDPFYVSLEEAIERERPDFVLNATPPAAHTLVNHLAFDYRIPVLCEKPIAEDYREAVQVVERAARENILLMIAENYRRAPLARRMKQVLQAGEIGQVSALRLDFFQDYYTGKAYLLAMANPLLVDVTVHHLDMVRYLAGSEGRRIFAHGYHPPGSPYPGSAAVDLILKMENGVRVSYSGSLVTRGARTSWLGDWRMEGSQGSLIARDDTLRLVRLGQETRIEVDEQDGALPLDDFLQALETGHQPETSGQDYLNTQCLVYHAEESIRLESMVDINCKIMRSGK